MIKFLADVGRDGQETAGGRCRSNACITGSSEKLFAFYSKCHSSKVGIRYAVHVKYLHSRVIVA